MLDAYNMMKKRCGYVETNAEFLLQLREFAMCLCVSVWQYTSEAARLTRRFHASIAHFGPLCVQRNSRCKPLDRHP